MKRNHILGFVLGFLLFCPLAFAATITVDTFEDEIDDALGEGADCSLREAIINANDNAATHDDCVAGSAVDIDVIELETGVYCLDATGAHENLSVTGDLDIAESMTIQGAGSGLSIIDAGSSSESVAAGCTTELNERIFHVAEDDGMGGFSGDTVVDATITLSGLTLRGGSAEHAMFNIHGGALYMVTTNATLNISDVVFQENQTQADAGETFGGAIMSGDGTTIDFENVSFIANQVSADADLALGGAVYFNDSVGTMTGLLVQNNSVSGDPAQADRGGAFLIGSTSNLTITNATFSNNTISVLNTISTGGAIQVEAGSAAEDQTHLTLQSTTFTNNTAELFGGALNISSSHTTVTVQNSVFEDNLSGSGPTCSGTVDAGTNNFVDDVTDCTFTAEVPNAADPLLLGLDDNGGVLETNGIDATSPLLDAGDCTGYTVTTDQRGDGFDREIGGACDVGAFELQEHTDVDGDGFFLYAADVTHLDCDDADDTINPDATEVCDDVDNNCDGDTDESTAADATTWYHDADADGYGDATDSQDACDQPSDYIEDDSDCDDTDDAISPDATELCDSVDNDCDGDIDEDFTDLGDSCSVGVGACVDDTGEMVCSDEGLDTECSGVAGTAEDEVCDDETDNDCDGDTDTDDADCVVAGDDDDDDDVTAASSGGCQLANGPAHSNAVVVLSGMGLLALVSFTRRQIKY